MMTSAGSGDLLRIGLGIEPEQFAQQRSRVAAALLTKTSSKLVTRPNFVQVTQAKPKLRPRLSHEDFDAAPGLVFNLR